MDKTTADRIDELLRERGITGAKMCTDLGLSRSFMTELRKGRIKNIGSERAARIAQYLGVSMEYLTGYGPRCRSRGSSRAISRISGATRRSACSSRLQRTRRRSR